VLRLSLLLLLPSHTTPSRITLLKLHKQKPPSATLAHLDPEWPPVGVEGGKGPARPPPDHTTSQGQRCCRHPRQSCGATTPSANQQAASRVHCCDDVECNLCADLRVVIVPLLPAEGGTEGLGIKARLGKNGALAAAAAASWCGDCGRGSSYKLLRPVQT